MTQKIIHQSYIESHNLFQKYSKSYYLGALLFSYSEFKLICAFYGFVRFIDDIVDSNLLNLAQKNIRLNHARDVFFLLYDNRKHMRNYCPQFYMEYPIYPAIIDTINKLNLPRRIFERFFNSMEMDLTATKYATYSELQKYMKGSAEIVGEVMLHIMVPNDRDSLLPYARKLGEAFQLTNFIRDIKEDYNMFPQRVYIPKEFITKHNVSLDKYWTSGEVDTEFLLMAREIIALNWKLYGEAQQGIVSLPRSKRGAIQLSKDLYSSILIQIKKNNYELFGNKIKVPFLNKLWITYNTLGVFGLGKVLVNYCVYPFVLSCFG